MKGFIIDPTYKVIGDKAFVTLFGRLENGESFVTINEYKPYFYIKKEDLDKAKKLKEKFEVDEIKFKNFNNEEVVKVIVDVPSDVPKLRDKFKEKKIECYESDIRFPYRFLIDNEIHGCVEIKGDYESNDQVDRIYKDPEIKPTSYNPKLNVLSFDIETDLTGETIFCIGIYTEKFKKVFIISNKKLKNAENCKDEEDLLEKFKEKVIELDPDIITGWNFIDFDFEILQKKFRQYRIPFVLGRDNSNVRLRITQGFMSDSKAEVVGRAVLDGMHLLRNSFISIEDHKLETAGQKYLGFGKLLTGESRCYEINDLFKKDPQKLVDYNLRDAELVYKILESSKILELTIKRSMITGLPLDRVSGSIAAFDFLYIKEARNRKIVCPSSKFEERGTRTLGGYVKEPVPGIYDYICVLDFKSLYPSMMRTFNIDPYSFVDDCNGKNLVKAPNGACFKNQDGILPSLLKKIWEERDIARKKKDELTRYALKIQLNSMYGVLASPNCRFYNTKIANAITHFGHHILKFTHKLIEERGYNVIYGDSITKDRFVTILDNDQLIKIINIEDLFNRYKDKLQISRGKEIINLKNAKIKAFTLNKKTLKPEFSHINKIIRHKTKKKVYRINQKYGETICSENHSIISKRNNQLIEVEPNQISKEYPLYPIKTIPKLKILNKIDLYPIMKNYIENKQYKGRSKIKKISIVNGDYLSFGWMNRKKPVLIKRKIRVKSKEFESLCRLLGAYIAEGSSSTIETTKSRLGASISSSNVPWLKILQNDYYNLFKNVKVSVIPSMNKLRKLTYINKSIKKTIKYNDESNKLQMMNEISAVFFKSLCGQGSYNKKLPDFIFHVPDKYKKLMLKFMIDGDGNRRENDKRYSKNYKKRHFSYTTTSLYLISGLSLLLKQLNYDYSIQYRPSKKSYTISTSYLNNKRIETKINLVKYKGYLYDLNVEKNNMFVDSCGQILLHNTDSNFVVTNSKNLKDAEKIGEELQNYVNDYYKKHIKKEYNRDSVLELEFEKCYSRFFMPKLRHGEGGAKKRYAGLLKDDKIEFVGLEIKRGDWTDVAKKFQYELFDKVFHKQEVHKFIKEFVQKLRAGKFDKDLVYKKQIRKELKDYAMLPPHVKAAKKMQNIESNLIEYIITTDGPEPIGNIKHKIDYEHYVKKQIKPLADSVLVFFNTNFDDMMKETKQNKLFDY